LDIEEKLSDLKEKILKRFNLVKEEEDSTLEEAVEKTEIPESYAQRFTLNPLDDPSQVLGREEELENLQKAYDNWKITRNPLLLVGEMGAGMTSLLNGSTKIYPHATILQNTVNINSSNRLLEVMKDAFGTPEAKKLTDISEMIDEEEKVIVFENVERLFLRKVNGFNLLEDFMLLIHATKKKVYWVVTINSYSLYYLNQTQGFSGNFLSIIRMKAFKIEYIQEVIQQRNKGYELIFLKPDTVTTMLQRKLNGVEADKKQEILKESFFKKLYAYSDGNISRSILFWKNSIARVADKRVYVKTFEPKPLGGLSLDELFILEAIMQHRSLSSHELRMVLRNSSKSSKLALEYLMEKGLVHPQNYDIGDPEYQINLNHLKALKNQIHSRLNRNFKS